MARKYDKNVPTERFYPFLLERKEMKAFLPLLKEKKNITPFHPFLPKEKYFTLYPFLLKGKTGHKKSE